MFKKKALILFFFMICFFFNSMDNLVAQNINSESLEIKSFFYPQISLTSGIRLGFKNLLRLNLKYYSHKMIYAVRYTDYEIFYIGIRPYREGIVLNHKEFSATINKIFYSPYKNVHCSIGSGLSYRMRNVRDERISYENWTEKEIQDIGLPIDLNIETFIKPTHFVFNFGYKIVVHKEQLYQGVIIDIGFWFGEKYNE
ncbi:MAG: hypothetical protein HQ534_06925 [Armatimonadetes bacterium]|nr:hypothetical protein [Armatimonadota bacterium]